MIKPMFCPACEEAPCACGTVAEIRKFLERPEESQMEEKTDVPKPLRTIRNGHKLILTCIHDNPDAAKCELCRDNLVEESQAPPADALSLAADGLAEALRKCRHATGCHGHLFGYWKDKEPLCYGPCNEDICGRDKALATYEKAKKSR